MNSNEIVVRTLLDGLAGRVELTPRGPFVEHSYNEAQVGDLRVMFWARMFIRRVAQVEFPDGLVIDYEKTETVPDPWVPTKDEFPEWWRIMDADEALPEQELADEAFALMQAARETEKQGRIDEAKKLRSRYSDTFDRQNLYNPFFYLTEDQQDALEGRLRNG